MREGFEAEVSRKELVGIRVEGVLSQSSNSVVFVALKFWSGGLRRVLVVKELG